MEPTLTSPGIAVVGAGFLGSRLVAALRAQGRAVAGIDPAPAAHADFPCTVADLPPGLAPGAFHLVFCCMATRGGDAAAYRACYLDTVRGLVRRFPEARVVFCSSLSVYAAGRLVAEDAPTRTDSPRADILLQAEAAVTAAGGIVARLAPLYGEGRCELLHRHLAGEDRLPGPASRMLSYLHVDDAAAALLCLAERGQGGGIYNLCGESLPHAVAYRLLEACTGIPAATACAQPSRRGAGDHTPDCRRLCDLGWAPRHRLQDFFRRHAPASPPPF